MKQNHEIVIEQDVNGNRHWATIKLSDREEGWAEGSRVVTGNWKATSNSYANQLIAFTSSSREYLGFTWIGGAWGGILNIGVHGNRGSHKAGEELLVQNLIVLDNVQRTANGEFKVGGVLGYGVGSLQYNINPHFTAGNISWTLGPYPVPY
ncbi:MAG TPA: hypothetical protein PKD24_11475 [Pyrinomonadaceae bacterium]|nr:hypothetical protein [Pyrinomonadaceae bacterium]HMP66136.1 hypothetical protein [Pyrinomonadaceae bacterium]